MGCSLSSMEKQFNLYSITLFEHTDNIRSRMSSQSVSPPYHKKLTDMWHTLERICRMAVDCGLLWKEESRNVRKRRALLNLLELLESSGLNRRMFELLEVIAEHDSFVIVTASLIEQLIMLVFVRYLTVQVGFSSNHHMMESTYYLLVEQILQLI